MAIAEGIHELLELGCPLDLEENFVVVVGYFDIEVFNGGGLAIVSSRRSRVGCHVEGCCERFKRDVLYAIGTCVSRCFS